MPEGDTLHKIAYALAPHLKGQRLLKVETREAESRLSGRIVRDVRALGKHLLIELDEGLILRSHLGMYGSWHRYARNEPWCKPRRRASIVLETAEDVFVCFNAKSVDLIAAGKVKLHPALGRLGPDLLSEEVDFHTVIRRARALVSSCETMADVLLNQQVACGIGNVYKCELLFLHRLHPETPLGRIDDETLTRIYQSARNLMQQNRVRAMRKTTDSGLSERPRHWVYGRAGRPCLKCGELIVYRRLGRTYRGTHWCPACQKTF